MDDHDNAQPTAGLPGRHEHRRKRRFRIEQEAHYKLLYGHRLAETGTARTLNMSSNGIWLSTDSLLPVGVPIELSINWPALLNHVCPMKLMIFGCVVRSDEHGAAISVERYEFRTQGARRFAATLQPSPETRLSL